MRYDHHDHIIEVSTQKQGDRWDWSVQAGPLPLKRNEGALAPTQNVAENEALQWAKRELGRRFPIDPE